ncbi:MAG: hypothetical protein LBM02_02840, partial [Lachnospiraceae bacterium]|nr:hypothetical protein [Lachnospiraceae bacterium]
MKSNIVGYIKKRINQNKLLCIIGIIASFGLFFSIYFGFIKGKIIENVGFLAISRNIIVFFVIAFIVLFLLLYIANKKQVKLHKTFFICSMVLGLVYMTLIPPLVAPDEPIHFYRAYEISNKMMG